MERRTLPRESMGPIMYKKSKKQGRLAFHKEGDKPCVFHGGNLINPNAIKIQNVGYLKL